MAKEKLNTSPKGRAVYPHLHAPDTKFDAGGVYQTKNNVPAAEAQAEIEKIDAAIAAQVKVAQKENPKKEIKPATTPYKVEEDGSITFNYKMKAVGKRKDGTMFKRRPRLFDAQGNPAPAGLRVGGGSLIRVSYEMYPFWTALIGAGVSLRLEAVQVIELKEFGGGNAESFGFAQEEGDFSADSASAEMAAEDADLDASDSDDGDAGDF